jgi:GH18 family chitinase
MKKSILIVIASLCLTTSMWAQKPCREVIGYWADWVNNSINYSKYTIINYAFVQPQADGSIGAPDATKLKNLVSAAHQNGTKVMLSIGGWTWSYNFPTIAANASSRQKFGSACAGLISSYNLDGVDIDWEYPCADNGGTPADKVNFTLLMQSIRSAIGGKLLSACFSPAQFKMDFIEWEKVSTILDMLNMMTYDMTGSWDKIAYHNSPLFASDGGDPTLNIDAVVSYLIVKYNVPRNKINIGAPFYGQGMIGVSELFGTMGGGDGTPTYAAILGIKGNYTEYWDAKAQVPYLLNVNTKKYISFDNPRSMEAKGQWVVNNKTRGVIVWETSGDGAGTPLANALAKGLCNPISPTSVEEEEANQPLIYPNPTSNFLNVIMKDGGNKNQVQVTNTIGQEVFSKQFNEGAFSVDMEGFNNGLYFVRITNENGSYTQRILKQ